MSKETEEKEHIKCWKENKVGDTFQQGALQTVGCNVFESSLKTLGIAEMRKRLRMKTIHHDWTLCYINYTQATATHGAVVFSPSK